MISFLVYVHGVTRLRKGERIELEIMRSPVQIPLNTELSILHTSPVKSTAK